VYFSRSIKRRAAYEARNTAVLRCLCIRASASPSPDPKAQPPVGSSDPKRRNTDSGPLITASGHPLWTIEILSDTRGVDFSPFLDLAMQRVRENWYLLIPPSAEKKKGKLAIEFAISRVHLLIPMLLIADLHLYVVTCDTFIPSLVVGSCEFQKANSVAFFPLAICFLANDNIADEHLLSLNASQCCERLPVPRVWLASSRTNVGRVEKSRKEG
jgi:hypothetical protein